MAGAGLGFADDGEGGAGEDVAAGGAPVAKDAVVEQGVGVAGVGAEEGRGAGQGGDGSGGFAEPDMGGEGGEGDIGGDAAVGIEDGRAEAVEAETAATLPVHGLGDTALFAVDDLAEAGDAEVKGVCPPPISIPIY